MSNRRRLRPHEQARRDQVLAEAEARQARGDTVIWDDPAGPGVQCSWCDCAWNPHDPADRHNRPGYVCPYPCPAEAVHSVTVWGTKGALPLCERHHGDWIDVFAALTQPSSVDVIGGWMDDE